MARCSCGNATCSCVVKAVANSGITVVGNGSPTRPYLIGNANAGGLTTVLDVTDTPTLNLEKLGTGVVGDKMSIYGTVTVKMTDLKDVADPQGGPQSGEVPVWITDHWEFRAPPTTPPGAVTASHGIGGDGSGATPLIAKTPLEWGGGPAGGTGSQSPDLRLWGADSLMGDPVYVDSAGQLRSMPQVIKDADSRNVTDPPGTYPMGTSIMSVYTASATSKGWPLSASCTVVSYRRHGDSDANANVDQWWYRSASLLAEVKYRFGNSSGWSAWKDIAYDSGWVDVTIKSGFAMQGTEKPQVRNLNGVIYSRGGWNSTAISANGTFVVGTVPAGYRPTQNVLQQAGTQGGGTTAVFFVAATGDVSIRTGPTVPSYMMLNTPWLTS